jgi:hypothetical protein
MVKWKMKKNNVALSMIYSFWCISVLFSFFIWPLHWLWFTASDVSLFFFIFHLTIALSVIYSFWCMSVLFHFSFDHCIVCDLQLLMYHCSFSFFIWPLYCLWFTASDVSLFFFIHQKLLITNNAMVKWKMKKNTDTSEVVNHRKCNGQMKNEKEQWYIRSCKSQPVQFHFSFHHCIVYDLQLLMYQCSFSFFIWPLHWLWWSNEKWKRTMIHQKLLITDNAMVKWKMKKNNDTSEAVNHWQCNGQMKNEKEHWFIWPLHWLWFTASDVSLFFFIFHLTIALSVIYNFWCIIVLFHFSFEKWKRTMINQKL